jgi:predicted xylose isomerase-like sugar epimerase
MAFDIRATVNGTVASKEKVEEAMKRLRQVLAEQGFTGIIEVREIGTSDAFVREVVAPPGK